MAKLNLIPGFRFRPTDVELVKDFLKGKVVGKKFPLEVIAEVDVYKYSPWDLPDKSLMSTSVSLERYFFCPRTKKYSIGGSMNRSTEVGYWKATGRDKPICHNNQIVGLKKVLVFYMGRPPKGHRTDWIMDEYRLDDEYVSNIGITQNSFVLCRVLKKDGRGPRNHNSGLHGKLFDEENWDDWEDSFYIIVDDEPLQIPPATLAQHNNNNLSPCECNWSLTPKSSSLSSVETHNPSVVNKDNVVPQIIPCNEDDACLMDYFTEKELSDMFALCNGDNNIEGEGTPFGDIIRDFEELNNLADDD